MMLLLTSSRNYSQWDFEHSLCSTNYKCQTFSSSAGLKGFLSILADCCACASLVLPRALRPLQIGGVSTRELNGLELEMLKLLEFRAFVSCSELSRLLKIVRGGYEPELAAQADALGSSTCRRSKKRVGDEVGSLDNNLPAKLQHDSQSSQILVTKESSQAEIGPPHVSGLGKPAVTVLACQQEILRLPMQSGTPVQLHIAITAGGD